MILMQNFVVANRPYKYESSKKILLVNALHGTEPTWGLDQGNAEFRKRQCQIQNCYITKNRNMLSKFEWISYL